MEFRHYADWTQLPVGVDKLFAAAERQSVFFSRHWFENLLENGLDAQQPLFASVIDGDEVLALLPLSRRDGDHYYPLRHLYSSLFTLWIADERRPQILACLAQGLSRLPAQSLQLDPIAEDDPNLHGLVEAMAAAGFSSERYFRFRNWIYRVDGHSFADYMAARPSRVRNTVARKRRKLAREHAYEIRLYGGDDWREGLADYHRVYSASWKPEEQFDAFVSGLAQRFSAAGWLRLAVLYIGGRPAAAQFWFVAHGRASIFKLAYDESWKHYSPGSILIAWLMEQVIDRDGVEEIDFLTGNDAYKQEWMSERRDRWRLCFIRPMRREGWLKRLKDRVYNPLFRQLRDSDNAADH